jgi:RNA recognition motif-containing protein
MAGPCRTVHAEQKLNFFSSSGHWRKLKNLRKKSEEIRMNIYVGNLSREMTEEALQQAFEQYGEVASAKIIKDKFSGESRGFGFVEMPVKAQAEEAISGLNGKEVMGRALNVNEARPRSDNRRGGGGGRRDY